jgi:hypothetical protein
MATIYFEITLGTPPFTATLKEAAPPYAQIQQKTGLGIGNHYFTDVPDSNYIIKVEEENSPSCFIEFPASVDCVTTTTTTVCGLIECDWVPYFDYYESSTIAKLSVGNLVSDEQTFDGYVIDWY